MSGDGKAIFLSYARDDAAAARRIAERATLTRRFKREPRLASFREDPDVIALLAGSEQSK